MVPAWQPGQLPSCRKGMRRPQSSAGTLLRASCSCDAAMKQHIHDSAAQVMVVAFQCGLSIHCCPASSGPAALRRPAQSTVAICGVYNVARAGASGKMMFNDEVLLRVCLNVPSARTQETADGRPAWHGSVSSRLGWPSSNLPISR